MILRLSESQAELIRNQARQAYPRECCGLLIGRRLEGGVIEVDDVRPCRNLLADERGDRFELDPADRLAAQRHARTAGIEIVGHYHSHPDAPAKPSATDRSMMYEPELAWLIASALGGELAAYLPNVEAADFDPLTLVISS